MSILHPPGLTESLESKYAGHSGLSERERWEVATLCREHRELVEEITRLRGGPAEIFTVTELDDLFRVMLNHIRRLSEGTDPKLLASVMTSYRRRYETVKKELVSAQGDDPEAGSEDTSGNTGPPEGHRE